MTNFVKLPRVCVPLTMDCDFKCRYCYREKGRAEVPEFNDTMRAFLEQLSPEWCEAVVAGGGEPLLYPERVKELFSYVPFGVQKKVMTNGANLTMELVDYFNELDVEVALSHDGSSTESLRGMDVLKDAEIREAVRAVNRLSVHSVCTALNPNPWKVFLEISRALGCNTFNYQATPVFEDACFAELIDGFDYGEYAEGRFNLWTYRKNPSQKYTVNSGRGYGVNVLPDGSVVGMTRILSKYGTVEDSIEDILRAREESGDCAVCSNANCEMRFECSCPPSLASNHFCFIQRINKEVKSFIRKEVYGERS